FTVRPGTGKSTLSAALRPEYGWVNYGDHLKTLAIQALAPHIDLSLEQVHANKERYRGFLQHFGSLIGFDDTDRFVKEALYFWNEAGRPPATFDNVRSDTQARAVKEFDFAIVRLELPRGIDRIKVDPSVMAHPIEGGISNKLVDVVVDASQPVDVIVSLLRRL